jgi:hypothetical protein
MSVETLCQLCEADVATEQCRRCGALVCSEHYDRDDGLCLDCAQQVDSSGDEGDAYEF